MHHVWIEKTNASESSLPCRELQIVSKLGSFVTPRLVYREPVYWVDGTRHRDGVISIQALMLNSRNLSFRCQGRKPMRSRVPMRSTGAEQLVVAMQYRNGYWAKRLRYSVIAVNQPEMG
jgi:hypothetical protein